MSQSSNRTWSVVERALERHRLYRDALSATDGKPKSVQAYFARIGATTSTGQPIDAADVRMWKHTNASATPEQNARLDAMAELLGSTNSPDALLD